MRNEISDYDSTIRPTFLALRETEKERFAFLNVRRSRPKAAVFPSNQTIGS